MKSRNFLKSILGVSLVVVVLAFMSSCNKDDNDTPAAPTIKIMVNSVEGFKVDIAAQASSDVVSWHWDYGDGTTSDSVGGHYHTYTERGDFKITCTVKNETGVSASAETSVHIATLEDLLSRKWQLSSGSNNGIGFEITPELTVSFPTPDIFAIMNSMCGNDYDFMVEYNDIYTFSPNGSLEIATNGTTLSSWVYEAFGPEEQITRCDATGFSVIKLNDVSNITWEMHEKDTLAIYTIKDLNQDGSPDDIDGDGEITENDRVLVKFPDANFITFSQGGYIGLKDYGVANDEINYNFAAIINSISEEEMIVTVFAHLAVDGDGPIGINEPCYLVKMTFKAVQ